MWWETLDEAEQDSVAVSVELLEKYGPNLGYPYSTGIKGSNYTHMRELRTQGGGAPLRTLYAFDPRRVAILLIGGDKTGEKDWYARFVPIADKIYEKHLQELAKEDHHGQKFF